MDKTGWTALHLAVDRGKRDAAEVLLRSGADPGLRCWPNIRARQRNDNGRDAFAIAATNGDVSMVSLLRQPASSLDTTVGNTTTGVECCLHADYLA